MSIKTHTNVYIVQIKMPKLKNENTLSFLIEKSISVSNLVNGTTRLQPVVLQIGQIAGLIASESVKNDISKCPYF